MTLIGIVLNLKDLANSSFYLYLKTMTTQTAKHRKLQYGPKDQFSIFFILIVSLIHYEVIIDLIKFDRWTISSNLLFFLRQQFTYAPLQPNSPVSLDYRIYQVHLCRRLRPPQRVSWISDKTI